VAIDDFMGKLSMEAARPPASAMPEAPCSLTATYLNRPTLMGW
jgi:hypothetical protein